MSVTSRIINLSADPINGQDRHPSYSLTSFLQKLLKTYKTDQDELTEKELIQFQLNTNTRWNPINFQEKLLQPLPSDRTMYHDGYIEYLIGALSHHYGIEVSPWHIWNIILREFYEMANANPSRYQKILSRNQGVLQLIQKGEFNIQTLIEHLTSLVPIDIMSLYPKFDQSPPDWLQSMWGLLNANSEASQIPKSIFQPSECQFASKISILGCGEQWNLLTRALTNLIEITQGVDPNLSRYLMQCSQKVHEIMFQFPNESYWKEFAWLNVQGLQGHIRSFMSAGTFLPKKMVSKYAYANTLGEQYYFISGLMCSQLDYNLILRPEYHCLTSKVISTKQDLSANEKIQLEIQLKYLMTIQKYDLRNVYKSHQYEVYNEIKHQYECQSLPDSQCVWFRHDEKPTNTYLSGSLEDSLYRDQFRMTEQLIQERSDPLDFKFLIDNINSILNFVIKDNHLPENVIQAFICTFDYQVIGTLILEYSKRSKSEDQVCAKLITSIIRQIDGLNYVEKRLRNSMITNLLDMFHSQSHDVVRLIQSKLLQSISSDLANQINLARVVTDHYQIQSVDLTQLVSQYFKSELESKS
jgi:hypothetical protein